MAPPRRASLKGFSILGLAASLWAVLFSGPVDSFAMLQPSQAAPQETPEMSRFRVGDRVRARVPMKISHRGRGYFNEGGGYGVPQHQRDEEEEPCGGGTHFQGCALLKDFFPSGPKSFLQEAEELERLPKVVEFGSEGYVVGILPAGEWANRPPGWKGEPRPGVMVSWDEASYPIDVAEEMFLTKIDGESLSKLHITARKMKWRTPHKCVKPHRQETVSCF
eukprot:g239.t1